MPSPRPTDPPIASEQTHSASEVPAGVLAKIKADAVEQLAATADQVRVVRAESVEWADGSLGCPQPGLLYTQALIRGYWVELEIGDLSLDYRSDADGVFRLCRIEGISAPSLSPPVGGEKTEPPGDDLGSDY